MLTVKQANRTSFQQQQAGESARNDEPWDFSLWELNPDIS